MDSLEDKIFKFGNKKLGDPDKVRDAKEYIESSISLIGYLS